MGLVLLSPIIIFVVIILALINKGNPFLSRAAGERSDGL